MYLIAKDKVLHNSTYLKIPQFGEGVHYDTKYDVEKDGGEDNEECHLVDDHVAECGKCIVCVTHHNCLCSHKYNISKSIWRSV